MKKKNIGFKANFILFLFLLRSTVSKKKTDGENFNFFFFF